MFDSIYSSSVTATEFFLMAGVAVVSGLLFAWIMSRRVRSTKRFFIVAALIPFVVGAVITFVNGNIGAGVAIGGAFSLIRFRSAQGTADEIAAILIAMGAGIAYLKGGRFEMIAHTVVNAVAVTSGIICDGAKVSCAAKIAEAIDAGLLGLAMYEDGNQFFGGDGIVKKGVENPIETIGKLASRGMQKTDEEIIRLMMEE